MIILLDLPFLNQSSPLAVSGLALLQANIFPGLKWNNVKEKATGPHLKIT